MTTVLQGRLSRMLEEAEFDIDEEVVEIGKSVQKVTEEIARIVGKSDRLFKNIVVPSGSFYENLKVEQPDEFDYMICLTELSKAGVCQTKEIPLRPVRDPGYVQVEVTDPRAAMNWREYISKRKNLKSKAMLEKFRELVDMAYRRVPLPKKLSRKIGSVELRKIPVTFHLIWNGDKYKQLDISLDFTLCIKFDGWPADSDFLRRFPRNHPGYSMVGEVVKGGYHLVASTIGESGKPYPCWRVSFSIAEGILLKQIMKGSRLVLVHEAAIKVLKVLRKKHESELYLVEEQELEPGQSVSYLLTWAFHSYVIKTMFFHEWAEFPEDRYWTRDKLDKRVLGILKRIRDSVRGKDIRSFWMRDYKLFNFRARRASKRGTERCEGKLDDLIRGLKSLSIREPSVKQSFRKATRIPFLSLR